MPSWQINNDESGDLGGTPVGPQKPAGKTLLGSLLGLASNSNPYVKAITTGLSLAGNIAGMFKPNLNKTTAAALQQSVEKLAMDLEQQVNAGTMDPDAAIQQLKSLQAQMMAGGNQTPEMANGKQRANLIIGQVLANLQTRQNTKLNDPFGAGNWNGGNAPNNLGGSVEQQKARLGTGLRNAIAGTDLGKTFAESSPIYQQATAKTQSPFERLPMANQSVQDQFPINLPDLRRPLKDLRF